MSAMYWGMLTSRRARFFPSGRAPPTKRARHWSDPLSLFFRPPVRRPRLDRFQLVRGGFARALVSDQFEADLLTFAKVGHPRAFDRADMNEGVFAAVIGLDEAEPFLRVVPFDCA